MADILASIEANLDMSDDSDDVVEGDQAVVVGEGIEDDEVESDEDSDVEMEIENLIKKNEGADEKKEENGNPEHKEGENQAESGKEEQIDDNAKEILESEKEEDQSEKKQEETAKGDENEAEKKEKLTEVEASQLIENIENLIKSSEDAQDDELIIERPFGTVANKDGKEGFGLVEITNKNDLPIPFKDSETKKAIDEIKTVKPLLKDRDVSGYLLSTSKLEGALKKVKQSLDGKINKIKQNQKEVYKHCLMVNLMSEELRRIADPEEQLIGSKKNEEMMRYFEILEVDVEKNQSHLNMITEVRE